MVRLVTYQWLLSQTHELKNKVERVCDTLVLYFWYGFSENAIRNVFRLDRMSSSVSLRLAEPCLMGDTGGCSSSWSGSSPCFCRSERIIVGGGLRSTEVAYLLLTQQPQVWYPALPKFFWGKIINVAEVYQWPWLEESGQLLENVGQTHLVLTSRYYKKGLRI